MPSRNSDYVSSFKEEYGKKRIAMLGRLHDLVQNPALRGLIEERGTTDIPVRSYPDLQFWKMVPSAPLGWEGAFVRNSPIGDAKGVPSGIFLNSDASGNYSANEKPFDPLDLLFHEAFHARSSGVLEDPEEEESLADKEAILRGAREKDWINFLEAQRASGVPSMYDEGPMKKKRKSARDVMTPETGTTMDNARLVELAAVMAKTNGTDIETELRKLILMQASRRKR